ncbi:MAG: leucine-rich repeat domain-containing protein [Lachnospiraceae bacterium]
MRKKTRYYKGLAALLALTLSFPIVPEIQTKAAEESETEYTTLEELEALEMQDTIWEDIGQEPIESETEGIETETEESETEDATVQQTVMGTWTHPGDGWHYLEGTDIRAYMGDNIIRLCGTGDFPDVDYWKLHERPWHSSSAQHLIIDSSITSIGAYAFYKCPNIKYITIATSTFINNKNAFEGISYWPVFRIVNEKVQTRMYGTIPYTSMDSILAFAQSNAIGAAYVLDDNKKATAFQESTNPTINNVYSAKNKKAPWNDIPKNSNGHEITPICKLSPLTPDPTLKVSAQRVYPGTVCYEVYAAFIEDYTFATTFNISVEKEEQPVKETASELDYILTIPKAYRHAGRSFRLLAVGEGEVYIYDDLDAADNTITFRTKKPTTAYALVYK